MLNKLKKILVSVGGGIAVCCILLVCTGHSYLLKGVANTYCVGRSGPSITESHIFENRKISAANPIPWTKHPNYGKVSLTALAEKKLDSISTASFVVVHQGKLLFEQYWSDYSANTPTNSFSVAKSIVGLLAGIALEEGRISDLNDPVAKYVSVLGSDVRRNVKISDVLKMSSGLTWIESGKNPFSDNAKAYYGDDLQEVIGNRKLTDTPGKKFSYKSGDSQLMAFVVREAVKEPLSNYAARKLWTPLNAESDALWNLDKENGMEKAFCCFYATSTDFARIGQLMLNKGRWGGKQLISEAYVDKVISAGTEKDEYGAQNNRYGWHWWCAKHKGMQIFYARGILGQYVIGIPERDLVVVRTGETRKLVNETGHPDDLTEHIDAALEMIE